MVTGEARDVVQLITKLKLELPAPPFVIEDI